VNQETTEKRYLTQRFISQRIGLTQGSINTLKQIAYVLKSISKYRYSRALIIRRAIEVYADHLVSLHENGLLHTEGSQVESIKGVRGRPTKAVSEAKAVEASVEPQRRCVTSK
jgi:hypothetical protein